MRVKQQSKYRLSSLPSKPVELIEIFTSKVAMSGCPSPYTTRAKYLARYISFRATEASPALWQYSAR